MIKISVESTPQTEERNAVTPVNKLIYGLNDKPAFVEAVLAAMQHVLAIFVGIIQYISQHNIQSE